jgi:hypothetical protein
MEPYITCQLMVEQKTPRFFTKEHTEVWRRINNFYHDIKLTPEAAGVVRKGFYGVSITVPSDAYDVYTVDLLDLLLIRIPTG